MGSTKLMNKVIYIIYILLILIVITGCQPTTDNTFYITVYGQIKDFDLLIPVDNVQVIINDKTTYTDFNGFYRVENIKVRTGQKLLWKAEKYDYLLKEKTLTITDKKESYLLNEQLKSQRIYSGSISGTINFTSNSQININKLTNTGINTVIHNNNEKEFFNLKAMVNNNYPTKHVKNEILVKFKYDSLTQKILNMSDQNNTKSVRLSQVIPSTDKKLPGKALPCRGGKIIKIKGPPEMTTEELLNYYKNLDIVDKISLNHIGYPMGKVPNDPLSGYQWYLNNMKLHEAWPVSTGSRSVTVAIIDTGYLPHPDLIDNIDTELDRDLVNNDYQAIDEDSYYNNNSDYLHSHGTHVSGIIGATGNNGIGITGINWKMNLVPIRIFKYQDGSQFFEEEDLISAINYAIDIEADVINLSLAMTATDDNANNHQLLESALENAYNNGVTIVAAAGNSGLNQVFYPASSQYTIAAGATGPDNELAYYSNYGKKLDILAPGGDTDYGNDNTNGIFSTHGFYNNNDLHYLYLEGTSMATPQIAGIAGLLYSQGVTSPVEVKNIITQTATPVSGLPVATNAGLVNAEKALYQVTQNHQYSNIKVMATFKEDDNYYVYSEIADVDYMGNYQISNVKTDKTLTIIAWIDNDDNQVISQGDYFGEYEQEISLTSREYVTDINLNIKYYSENERNVYHK